MTITICSIKRKENFFSLVFFSSAKRAVLSRLRRVEGGARFLAREQKKSGKKFFLFIGHEVLFYETPFLHGARQIYVCGGTALARPHLQEVSSSGGSSHEFWDTPKHDFFRVRARTERPITCVSALYDARQAS
jgi:hypothetical protein